MFRFWQGRRLTEREQSSTRLADELRRVLPGTLGLSQEEEKVLRMRNGVAAADRHHPLPAAADGNRELAHELQRLEMQLFRAQNRRLSPSRSSGPKALEFGSWGPQPVSQKAKDKIVRALRKKNR